MEVILLENIGNLGTLGDKVDVKPGYGRNFLIPQGKAVICSSRHAQQQVYAAAPWPRHAHT